MATLPHVNPLDGITAAWANSLTDAINGVPAITFGTADVPTVISTAGTVNLGSDGKSQMTWVRIGKILLAHMHVAWGTVGTSFGTGTAYFIQLPAQFAYASKLIGANLSGGYGAQAGGTRKAFFLRGSASQNGLPTFDLTGNDMAGQVTPTSPWTWANSNILFSGIVMLELV